MEEIVKNVFIETQYPGVTLGAIQWSHGTIFIDAPLRMEDIRSWRSSFLHPSSLMERFLVNLDAHLDRTVGVRSMECTVVGHEKMAAVFRNRPVTYKFQSSEIGAISESMETIGSIRWAPPDATFSDNLAFTNEEIHLVLETRPGPSTGSIWVTLPQQEVVFVGDAVMVNQPPFLACANIPQWIETLEKLLSPEYSGFKIISGRNGLLGSEYVVQQLEWLKSIDQRLQDLAAVGGTASDTEKMIPLLLREYNQNMPEIPMFKRRLKFGLFQYFTRHFNNAAAS